ncbi:MULTISPECIES: hypothetical protein [unclassified Geodermatophilus]
MTVVVPDGARVPSARDVVVGAGIVVAERAWPTGRPLRDAAAPSRSACCGSP